MIWSTGPVPDALWVLHSFYSRLKLEEYVIPMKWASFLGSCALLVFLPLNIYVMSLVRKTLFEFWNLHHITMKPRATVVVQSMEWE